MSDTNYAKLKIVDDFPETTVFENEKAGRKSYVSHNAYPLSWACIAPLSPQGNDPGFGAPERQNLMLQNKRDQ